MKILIILVVLFLVIGVWIFLKNPALVVLSDKPMPSIDTSYSATEGELKLRFTLKNSDSERIVTYIYFPHNIVVEGGIEHVPGFTKTPFSTKDGYTEEQAKEKNEKEVQYVGSLVLKPEQETILSIPITGKINEVGQITGMHESKGRLGGSISFFSINVN